MNKKYEYIVSEDGQSCSIFLLRPYKYIGKVTQAKDGRSLQQFAPGVIRLPIYSALEAMEAITKEESILGQLGV